MIRDQHAAGTISRGWHIGLLLALAVLSGALCAAVYLVFVQTARGQHWDNNALSGAASTPPRIVRGSLDLLETISVASLAVAGITIMAIGMLQRRLRLAAGAGTLILGANVTTQILKRDLLPRPALLGVDPFGSQNSLPSGHTTVAMSVALALILVVPPAQRPFVAVPAGAYAICVGTATILASSHRPSDVVAAYLVATAWAAIVAAVLLVWCGATGQTAGRRLGRVHLAAGVAFSSAGFMLLSAAVAVLGMTYVFINWGNVRTVALTGALVTGVLGSAGSGILLITILTALLRGIDLDQPLALDNADGVTRDSPRPSDDEHDRPRRRNR